MTSSRKFSRKIFAQVVVSILIFGLIVLTSFSTAIANDKTTSTPKWVWSTQKRDDKKLICIDKNFFLSGTLKQAHLVFANNYCDAYVFINKDLIEFRASYDQPLRQDVTASLKNKNNRIIFCCTSTEGPSAVMCKLDVEYTNGKKETFVTDDSWKIYKSNDSYQNPVVSFGEVNSKVWGLENPITIKPTDDYTQWKQALQSNGPNPKSFETLDGFDVSLVRAAKEDEDSWIAMTFDSQGRLIVSKEKKGLLRFTLDATSSKVIKTEVINTELRECRGLLFDNDSLYAMANNDKALFQLKDSTGDDQFDEVTKLSELPGDVGHGRNQIRMGPDGKIYLICGDAVHEPKGAKSLVPALANPTDYEKARSGYLARFDLETKQWEIITRGLRNPYGIDFNPLGEIFTYDADAEYDMGASWYRPTRVNQLFPGTDFGWRRVTKKWPPYFHDRPDMPRPILDIGKGSPTSVLFGTKSNFPKEYQKALFVLDWAYGRILAIHFEPQGASYQAAPETFLRGKPLNVTDLKFGPDGAMYFITGGRKTESALYRVKYTGEKKNETKTLTQQEIACDQYAKKLRAIRLNLESFLGKQDPKAIELAWQYLSHDDPTIGTIARSVLKWQNIDLWKKRIPEENDRKKALAAMMALVRIEKYADSTFLLNNLSRLSLSGLKFRQISQAIFVFNHLGMIHSFSEHSKSIKKFNSIYPHRLPRVNLALSRLLSKQNVPNFPKRTISLLEKSKTPEERFHYLFVLRNTKLGWTPKLRDIYFDHLAQASGEIRGAGLPTFLKTIATEALANVPDDQKAKYQKQIEAHQNQLVISTESTPPRSFVRKWTLKELEPKLPSLKKDRNIENGKAMFIAAKCSACHRVNRKGGVLGPDLTSVASRFSPLDILKSILEPSEVIAPKYQSSTLVLSNGKSISGMILPGDYRSEKLEISSDPLDTSKQITVLKKDILHHKPSTISIMPEGLLNTLSEQEILDLLAYVFYSSSQPIP